MNVTGTMGMPDGTSLLGEISNLLTAVRADLFVFCAAVVMYGLLSCNASPKNGRRATSKVKDKGITLEGATQHLKSLWAGRPAEPAPAAARKDSQDAVDGVRRREKDVAGAGRLQADVTKVRAALKAGSFDEASQHFRELKTLWAKHGAENTPSAAPRRIVSQLVDLANKEQRLDELLPLLEGVPISETRYKDAMSSMLAECTKWKDGVQLVQNRPQSDVGRHITMIRKCAAAGNLPGAMEVFETVQKSGAEVNSVVYNTVLDACVECRDLPAAEAWMARMKEVGLADVVSYNTLIKAHLLNENFGKARELMEEMRNAGLQPNRVTFNELVNGLVTRGTPAQRSEIWDIVKEMRAVGVMPNQVTCSILLKSLNAQSTEADILQTMDLTSSMEEPMDEVLLSSLVEACVRIGKPDLLAAKLKQLQNDQSLAVNGSHTFGSLIKAYGHAKDINGVWRCWKEMRSRQIRPTSITLGCMVEAVVSNGDTEGAYELIHQMQQDERCRDALNAVIYCSVLKGFTRERKIERVWEVYEEMLTRKVDLSVVTYNTLLDACARCGRMDRAPGIVKDMQSQGIRPNLITYSTMVKGHCQAGDIERGFAILEEMKREAHLKPDEIMYNSLLDGCAQNNLVEAGLGLLERMESEGVQPSNFTLSLLVKLMSRARKLDSAFSLVEEISRKYHYKPNVHVYNNLIQACIANRQLPRGVALYERMLKDRVRPDSRTYSILERASTGQGLSEQHAALIRSALASNAHDASWRGGWQGR